MKAHVNELCIVTSDDWHDLKFYKIRSIGDKQFELSEPDDWNNSKPPRIIKGDNQRDIFTSPFSIHARKYRPEFAQGVLLVRDFVSSLVHSRGKIACGDLIGLIMEYPRAELSPELAEKLLKYFVAQGAFIATVDKRKKIPIVSLTLGEQQIEWEKQRKFAGSLASELDALSDRIRLIISHGSTVGTYRENLLQGVLKKHLPERYHVATGFIYGCARQIDILIYDRLDYAPLFREGDLVVVPSEAVRAIIEVKTKISSQQLRDSLELLDSINYLDDRWPPIFRGVFGFESEMSPLQLCEHIKNYYNPSDDIDSDAIPEIICRPYDHISCACVLGQAFAYVRYSPNEDNRITPMLYTKTSVNGLTGQVSHFMQELLSFLRYGGLKNNYYDYMQSMLGADTLTEKYADLATSSWGAYFGMDNGIGDNPEQEVEEMKQHIHRIQSWLEGGCFVSKDA